MCAIQGCSVFYCITFALLGTIANVKKLYKVKEKLALRKPHSLIFDPFCMCWVECYWKTAITHFKTSTLTKDPGSHHCPKDGFQAADSRVAGSEF